MRRNFIVRLAVLFVLIYVFAVGCATGSVTPISPPGTPTPTPPRERLSEEPYAPGAYVTADLEIGAPLTGAEAAMIAAVADECADRPAIIDSRPEGHNSLSVLPRLAPGDYDQAQEFFKFQLSDVYGCQRADPGQKYWDIKALFLECGAANFQPQVFDIDGNKITDVGILMFMNWPGTEPFPYAVDPPYFQNGVAGFTENGDIGWAYGGESHIGPDGGPYNIWASSDPAGWSDRRVGSDAYLKAGWWDDHCEFSPIYQTVRKAGGTVDPGEGYELVDTDEQGNETGRIPFQSGDNPPDGRLLKLQLDGVDVGVVPWE